jgi:hypothetical protein
MIIGGDNDYMSDDIMQVSMSITGHILDGCLLVGLLPRWWWWCRGWAGRSSEVMGASVQPVAVEGRATGRSGRLAIYVLWTSSFRIMQDAIMHDSPKTTLCNLYGKMYMACNDSRILPRSMARRRVKDAWHIHETHGIISWQ